MSTLNRATILGNVGRDPEIRSFQNGGKVANLSIATSEKWKDKNTGESKERTEWHRVSVFDDLLVRLIEQYVTKGSKILVEGQIETRKWQDQSGQDRYSTEIVLRPYKSNLVLLGGGQSGNPAGGYQDAQPTPAGGQTNYGSHGEIEDEIPF